MQDKCEEIKRNRYLERLISRMNNGMIIVVNSNTPVWRNEQGILVMKLCELIHFGDSPLSPT